MSMASRIIGGFVAGALSVLLFHQGLVWLLGQAGVISFPAYSLDATAPFGVPAMLSLAFWGGLWGIAWAWLAERLRDNSGRLGLAFLFGAILPTLVAAVIVIPLKGGDPKIFLQPMVLVGALIINGVWGLGTELILRLGRGRLW